MMSVWVNWNSFSFFQSSFCQFTIRLDLAIQYIYRWLFLFVCAVKQNNLISDGSDGSMKPCELSIYRNGHVIGGARCLFLSLNVCIGGCSHLLNGFRFVRGVYIWSGAFHTSNAIKIQRWTWALSMIHRHEQIDANSFALLADFMHIEWSSLKWIKKKWRRERERRKNELLKFAEMQWSAGAS